MQIRTVAACRKAKGNVKVPEVHEMGDEVPKHGEMHLVQAGGGETKWLGLGKGDIVIDSAADESYWPAGQRGRVPHRPAQV